MNTLDRYYKLMSERPKDFKNHGEIDIILNRSELEAYQKENNVTLGVIYESRFHLLLVDLVRDINGTVFTYERMLNAVPGGTVMVTVHNGKFVLLKQYRHAMRDFQYAFPRGFKELGLTSLENAKKELSEELNNTTANYEKLGAVVADSGLCGNIVDVFKCEIVDDLFFKVKTEGIVDILEVTDEELTKMIHNNQITDCFSLAAICLIKAME